MPEIGLSILQNRRNAWSPSPLPLPEPEPSLTLTFTLTLTLILNPNPNPYPYPTPTLDPSPNPNSNPYVTRTLSLALNLTLALTLPLKHYNPIRTRKPDVDLKIGVQKTRYDIARLYGHKGTPVEKLPLAVLLKSGHKQYFEHEVGVLLLRIKVRYI